jgi:hypothetical protein
MDLHGLFLLLLLLNLQGLSSVMRLADHILLFCLHPVCILLLVPLVLLTDPMECYGPYRFGLPGFSPGKACAGLGDKYPACGMGLFARLVLF